MLFLSLLALAGTAVAAGCNGNEALCSKKYSDVILVGSHDSAFVGVLPTENQFDSISNQLSEGVRFLQSQTHNDSGTIEMCHTYCWEEDAGSFASYLSPIATFMSSNPNEVLTLLVTNGDAIPVAEFDTAFSNAGLKQYVYTPDGTISKDEWPTLQELIDNGTRLLVFMDYNADQSIVPYIIPEFDYFWETTYTVTDSSFPDCSVDRPTGGDPTKLMGIMNHMLHYEELGIQIPDEVDAGTTNSLSSIDAEYQECVSAHGVGPNVILLDYISVGDAIEAQNNLNGL